MREALRRLHQSGLRLLCLAGVVALAASVFACGARTGVDSIALSQENAGAKATIDPSRPGGGGGGNAGAPNAVDAGASAGAPQCESVDVSIDDLRPAITIMVDQSRSMRFGFPTQASSNTRWSIVGQALFNPQGVVRTYEARVRFGIAFFTGHTGTCPLLNEVSAATGNYAALNALYERLAPDGDTPTGEALQQVTSELQVLPTQGPRSVLLVTDGNPDTCAQPQPDDGQPVALAAVQRAHAAGIDVYVLGVSNDIGGENLQQLANAGKGKPIDLAWGVDADAAQPYQASSSVLGLVGQLAEILNSLPLCQVNLRREVATSEASAGRVTLDGRALGYSHSDGFDLKDPRHLEIVGPACDALKAGGKQLSVRIGCD
jgi:Mg-chelatase subunit ChlD